MNCQSLFSRKNKEDIINLLSVEFAIACLVLKTNKKKKKTATFSEALLNLTEHVPCGWDT